MKESDLIFGNKYKFRHSYITFGRTTYDGKSYGDYNLYHTDTREGTYLMSKYIAGIEQKYYCFVENNDDKIVIYYAHLEDVYTRENGTETVIDMMHALRMLITSATLEFVYPDNISEVYSGLKYFECRFTPKITVHMYQLKYFLKLVKSSCRKIGYFISCSPPHRKFTGGALYKRALVNYSNRN